MTYEKWDKLSPVNRLSADQVIANNPLYGSEDSYLFYGEDGTVYDIIPVSYLPAGDTPEARCEAFIEKLSAAKPATEPSAGITAEKALEILLND